MSPFRLPLEPPLLDHLLNVIDVNRLETSEYRLLSLFFPSAIILLRVTVEIRGSSTTGLYFGAFFVPKIFLEVETTGNSRNEYSISKKITSVENFRRIIFI